MVEVVREDDPVNAVDRSDSPPANVVDRSDSPPANVFGRPDSPPANVIDRPDSPPTAIPLVDLSWVVPRVVEFSFTYDAEKSVPKFLAKYSVLKAGEDSDDSRDPDYFRILPCGSTERECMDQAGVGPPFFTCTLASFQIFMCPSPSINSQWASFGRSTWHPPKCIQIRGHPFKRFACCMTPCGFAPPLLLFFTIMALIPVALPLGFLAGRPGHVLFDPFAVSYKRFKERFVKVVIQPEATTFFFDRAGWSRFPLHWTSKPKDFKFWLRPTRSEEEVEILSFFDALPRKLPCQSLIGAYTETAHWATIRGMGSSFVVSVGNFLFVF